MAITTVLFDLGDTLWHFPKMPPAMEIRMETMRRIGGVLEMWGVPLEGELRFLGREIRLGVEQADRAAYESDCVSPDFNEVVRGIVAGMGLQISYEQAAQLWDAWNLGGLTLGRTMFDDAFETLDWLRERGIRIGCVTNRVFGGPRFVEELAELGLDRYFEATAISCDMGYMKPHPRIFEQVLGEMNVRPQETAMVGDSLRADVQASQALGMAGIWRKVRKHDPPHEAEQVGEVPPDTPATRAQTGRALGDYAGVEGVTPDYAIYTLRELDGAADLQPVNFSLLALAVTATASVSVLAARRTGQYALFAVAGTAIILLLHARVYFDYTSDDAYISFRYARNLADGVGLVWNPGEHVEGYSNFLWVMILAGAHKLGADIVVSGRWLGFAFAVAAGLGTYALSRDLLDGAPGRLAGVAAAMLLAACGTWALWSTAGLENSLMGMLVLAGVLLHIREQDGASLPASGVVWAAVAMTRPDGLVFFGVSALFKAGEALVRVRGGATSAREAVRLAAWLAGFAAVFVPYFAWRYSTYGWLFPNTYYAKVGSGIDQYNRGLRYVMTFSREQAAALLLLVPVALALTPLRRAAGAYVLAVVAAWFAATVYVGGDSLVRTRLFTPVMPLFYALIATSGVALFITLTREERERRWIAEVAGGIACIGLLVFTLHASADGYDAQLLLLERHGVHDRRPVGRWMGANLPDSTVVAVVPAGIIPYESRLPTIDMLGLNDEHIAHRDLHIGEFSAGHEKYDSEYVLDKRPDIIILYDGLTGGPWGPADYSGLRAAALLIPAVVDMLAQPRLFQEYELRAVQVAPGWWFNLLVRRDAAAVLALTQAVPD